MLLMRQECWQEPRFAKGHTVQEEVNMLVHCIVYTQCVGCWDGLGYPGLLSRVTKSEKFWTDILSL